MAIYEVHHYNPETGSVDVDEIEAVSFKTARDGNSVTFYNSIYADDQNKVAFFNKVVSIWKTEQVYKARPVVGDEKMGEDDTFSKSSEEFEVT